MTSANFLDLAKQGKNQWWRYLIGVLSILLVWLVIGTIAAAIALVFFLVGSGVPIDRIMNDQAAFEQWLKTPTIGAYVVVNLQFIFLIAATFMVVKWLHQRPIGTLISGRRSPNWSRIWSGFWVWGLLLALFQVPLYFLNPQSFQWTFEPQYWVILVAIALILTPIQTSAEEFFFRGYLLQGKGLLLRNRLALCLISGIIFALPHFLNPEMARDPVLMGLNYLGMGIFFAYITLRDQSLDLALGVHAANNLYSALLVNTQDSTLPTKALLTVSQPEPPAVSLLVLTLMVILFYGWFFRRRSALSESDES
jgi:uncharacterized protein